MHQWFVIPFEKSQSWRWQVFLKTRVGKGIFPPGSHENVPGCFSIISPFFFFFFSFCQLNFLGFSHSSLWVLLERSCKVIEDSSLLLQVSTLGLNLLLLPHPDVRSRSSFLPVVSHNSDRRGIIYRQQYSFVSKTTIKLHHINSTDKFPPYNQRQYFWEQQ